MTKQAPVVVTDLPTPLRTCDRARGTANSRIDVKAVVYRDNDDVDALLMASCFSLGKSPLSIC